MPRIEKWADKQLTVGQLVGSLMGLPQSATVTVEGCDCIGECGGITWDTDDNDVLIIRF